MPLVKFGLRLCDFDCESEAKMMDNDFGVVAVIQLMFNCLDGLTFADRRSVSE